SRKRAEAALAGLVECYFADTDEYVVRLPLGENENQFAKRLLATTDFDYAEPDWILFPLLTPNDAFHSSQWHHVRMQSRTAWNTTTGSATITCAFVDTGIDLDHPDLAARIVPGYNAVSQTPQSEGGVVADENGHGTMVAGTACAIGNNSIGVAGVGWNQRIMMVRATDSPDGSASISNILSGARWAANNGAKVVSASYGGASNVTVGTTGTFIRGRGALFCYAAGNSSSNLAGFDHLDTIICGATDQGDNRASFSSFGRAVDVFAPGVDIWTTLNGGGYGGVSGTSFSTPMTNGVISMIWSLNPSLDPDTVDLLLRFSCDDLGATGEDDTFGFGRVNLLRAVQQGQASLVATAPVVANDNAVAFPAVATTIDVLANDYDINGNLAGIGTFSAASTSGGSVTRSVGSGPDGRDQLIFTAASGFIGNDTFTYQAIDSGGLATTATVTVLVDDLNQYRLPDHPTFTTTGLYSYYYDIPATTSVLPDFSQLTHYRRSIQGWINEPSTNDEFADSNRTENVAARYAGYLNIIRDARYTFYTESDDGSKLYVGDQLIVSNDGLHGMQERSGQIALRAGLHKVRAEFFERGGGAGMICRMEGGPIPKQVIRTIYWFREVCTADLNGDNANDLSDLSIVLGNFGATGDVERTDGDINGDGEINLSDLSLILSVFGEACP
ncbi:MAG: S8 family serine peptidase, partial [Phycisphaerae bacterium]